MKMWVIIPALLLTAAVVQADEAVESPSEIAVTAGGIACVSPDYPTFQINISTTHKSAVLGRWEFVAEAERADSPQE